MKIATELIVFLGPTLPQAEARLELAKVGKSAPSKALRVSIEPPARQGDVWRALQKRPRALALIDGVFEASPSVWHHELLDALDAGVLVFGAASMGALRASELSAHGMIGVGEIFARYRNGLDDDAAVALLHAGAEHAFAPMTIPSVNAEHAIDVALREGVVSGAEARKLRAASSALHYQERRWPLLLERAGLSRSARARWDVFAARGLPDLKAEDARLCLRESARAALAQRLPGASLHPKPRAQPSSAHVRARRALQSLEESAAPPPSQDAARDAMRTLLLAGLARATGTQAAPEELAACEQQLMLPARDRAARDRILLRAGIAEDEFQKLLETLALEQRALDSSSQLLPDGPSPIEAARLAQLLATLGRGRL